MVPYPRALERPRSLKRNILKRHPSNPKPQKSLNFSFGSQSTPLDAKPAPIQALTQICSTLTQIMQHARQLFPQARALSRREFGVLYESLWFRLQGLGSRVWSSGLGFRVSSLDFKDVEGLEFKVLGFRVSVDPKP